MLVTGALTSGALLGSALVVVAVRSFARRRRLLDVPNERSAHGTPTPRLGGIGIVVAFALTWALWILHTGNDRMWVVLAAVCFVSTVGVVDDLRPLTARVRFLLQIVAAAVVVWVLRDGLEGLVEVVRVPGWALGPAAILWIVWLTNLYNFMDGIDGLAGGQAVVAASALAIAALHAGSSDTAVVLALLAAASAGFLVFNFPPATIFMGDVGSTAIGFFLGCVPFLPGEGRLPVDAVWIAVGLFVLDATTTLCRRMLAGERWFAAHRSHWYQRPLRFGIPHSTISGTAYVGMLALALATDAYVAADPPVRLALLASPLLVFAALTSLVRRLESGAQGHAAEGF